MRLRHALPAHVATTFKRLTTICGLKAAAKTVIEGMQTSAAKSEAMKVVTRLISSTSEDTEYCMQSTTISSARELAKTCTVCARERPPAPR